MAFNMSQLSQLPPQSQANPMGLQYGSLSQFPMQQMIAPQVMPPQGAMGAPQQASMPDPRGLALGLDRQGARQDWRAQRPQFAPGMDRQDFRTQMQDWRALRPQFGNHGNTQGDMRGSFPQQGMPVPPMGMPGMPPQGAKAMPGQSGLGPQVQPSPSALQRYTVPQQANPSFLQPQSPLGGKPSSGGFFGSRRQY